MDIIIPEFETLLLCAQHGYLSYLHQMDDKTRIIIHEDSYSKAGGISTNAAEELGHWVRRGRREDTNRAVITEATPPSRRPQPVERERPMRSQTPVEPPDAMMEWFRARMATNTDPVLVLYKNVEFTAIIANLDNRLEPGESLSWNFDRFTDYIRAVPARKVREWENVISAFGIVTNHLTIAVQTRSWG